MGPSLSRSAGEGAERSEAGEGASAIDAAILGLLGESLKAWRVAGEVRREAEAIVVETAGKHLRVTVAPPELPFRWMLDTGARQRGVTGIPGLLRAVRRELQPDYATSRLQLAARPVLE